jgi:hypothetical protein
MLPLPLPPTWQTRDLHLVFPKLLLYWYAGMLLTAGRHPHVILIRRLAISPNYNG